MITRKVIEPRSAHRVEEYERAPKTSGLDRLRQFADLALARSNAIDPKLRQSREPGEEG